MTEKGMVSAAMVGSEISTRALVSHIGPPVCTTGINRTTKMFSNTSWTC